MSDKYVLGGGLSGLIWAYYNPEYTLLTYEYGGFVDTKFGRAFVVLHETEEMNKLFKELGIDAFVKELNIGYYDDGVRREAPDGFAREYVEWKLPPEFQPGKDLELSAPGDSWRALFVDSGIVKALKNEVETKRIGLIEEITEDAIHFKPGSGSVEELEWDEIISTMPATAFQNMCDVDWDLDNHPTTYAEITDVPERYRTKSWNLLYTVDPHTRYHRIVRNMLSSNYFVEFLGDVPEREIPNCVDRMTNKYGVISDEDLEPPFDGISFLGRYAQWQHDVRIDHVIEKAVAGEL